MKKQSFYSILGTVLGILTLVGVLFFGFKFVADYKGDSFSAFFTLEKNENGVFYKSEDGDYKELTEDKIGLPTKSFVKTGDGLATIIFPNNSLLSLDSNTEVQINLDNDSNIDINQMVGNTWSRVQRLSGSESFKIETPTALATVRGTKFAVEVNNEKSDIYVTESVVEVGQLDKSGGKKEWKNVQRVEKDKFASVPDFQKTKGFNLESLSESKKQSRWYQRNIVLDKLFDEIKEKDSDTILERFKQRQSSSSSSSSRISAGSQSSQNLNSSTNAEFEKEIKLVLDKYLNTVPNPSAPCANISGVDVQTIVNQLTATEEKYGVPKVAGKQILPTLNAIKSACSDGRITPEESRQIDATKG